MSNRVSTQKASVWSGKIRMLSQCDLPLVADHFLRLDAAGRRERFGSAVSDTDIEAYTKRLPFDRGVLAGCFPDETLRGLVEARPVAGESCHWECVLSVESAWRRKRLGLNLTGKAIADARQAGASRMYLRCSTSSEAGQYFLTHFTNTLREDDGDVIAAIDLAAPVLAASTFAGARSARSRI